VPVTLRPVDAATWRRCRDLEVHEHQRAFVSPVASYLALTRFGVDGWSPFAIFAGQDVIEGGRGIMPAGLVSGQDEQDVLAYLQTLFASQ